MKWNPTRSGRSAGKRLAACTGVVLLASGMALVPLSASAQELTDPVGAPTPTTTTTATEPYAVVDKAPADLKPADGLAPAADGAAVPSDDAPDTRLGAEATGVETFNMIGLSATTATPDDAFVRIHTAAGWQPWEPASLQADSGPTPGSAEAERAAEATGGVSVGEPLWVGAADGYEINLPADATDAKVLVVHERTRPAGSETTDEGAPVPTQGQPPINPRSAWGARAPKVAPEVAPALRFAIVHHSVTTNDYGPGEVPAILRSVQAFHMDGNGWDDIGYNFAIDRFGTIWEARSGGLDRAVIGAHAFDDNYESTGIVGLGEFDSQAPTSAMLSSYSQLIGWKLQLHGWDVNQPWNGHPAVVGHRDVNQTACPGQQMWDRLGTIRAGAAAKQAQMRAIPGFWGVAAVNRNLDGRLEVFSLRNDNTIWHNWQFGSGWSGWYPLMAGVAGKPTVINNADGRLEVFAVSTLGEVVHMWQYLPNSGWSGVYALGGSASPQAGVAAEVNPDGRIEIFSIHDNDVLYHMYQFPGAPGGWSNWYPLGSGFPSNAGLDAIANPDGRLEVFANSDGHILRHSFQIPNAGWSPMYSLDMPGNGGPSVARNHDGRLEVFATDDNGVVWHKWQYAPNSGWSAAAPLVAGFDYGSSVKVAPDAFGRLHLFGTTDTHILQSLQQAPAGGWGGVSYYGGVYVTGTVDANILADNRMLVAAMELSGSNVAIASELSPGGAWTSLSGI